MILHFTDGEQNININFDAQTYNYKEYTDPTGFIVTVSAYDLGRIQREIDFNCYGYTDDIYQAAHDEGAIPF